MNNKQRDIMYRHWCGVIQRETRDLAALRSIRDRLGADRDVRSDPTLESMIQAELQSRMRELEQEMARTRISGGAHVPPTAGPSEAEEPMPAKEVLEVLAGLARAFIAAVECGNEGESQTALEQIRTLQQNNPAVVPGQTVADYQAQVTTLRAHLKQLREQIVALTDRARIASQSGVVPDWEQALRQLTAIHLAHPGLLAETELSAIRAAALHATDEHRQDRHTTQALLTRERAIMAEIKELTEAVHDFHRVVCTVSDDHPDFHVAQETYLRIMQRVRACNAEWFTNLVLELADVLADWTLPPAGAELQIDRFLDSISRSLKRIRETMRAIATEQDATGEDEHQAGTH